MPVHGRSWPFMDARLWVVGCGLWVVGRGLWVVGRGSWVVGRGGRGGNADIPSVTHCGPKDVNGNNEIEARKVCGLAPI